MICIPMSYVEINNEINDEQDCQTRAELFVKISSTNQSLLSTKGFVIYETLALFDMFKDGVNALSHRRKR